LQGAKYLLEKHKESFYQDIIADIKAYSSDLVFKDMLTFYG